MKLTEIAIEGNTHSGRFQFGPLDRGLNFIYGENGAGKTFLSSFLSQLLLPGSPRNPSATGHATCSGNLGTFVLRQTADVARGVQIESLTSGQAPITLIEQMTGPISPVTHDTLFNFSLRESDRQRYDLARLLHENFSVAIGPEAADSAARVDHQPEIQRLNDQLVQLKASVASLNQTRSQIVSEISLKQSDQNRLIELNQQIDQVTFQLNQLNRSKLESQLASIDQQIQTLQLSIDRLSSEYVTQSTAQPVADGFKHLYQRLDEVDQQLERWRHVQSDVQHQRVRLKDEMIVWNEMTLESDDHPYHNAREILVGLESRVDQAEQTAARWSGTTASQIDVTQMAEAVENICRQMRADLYSLCAELSSQYKHIRQRAAAVELKQLRRCYHEMGENTARLVQRRQQVIDEIRAVDPAGADAIQRSEQAFCQCAAHEGYLAARRRFLGDVRPATQTVTRVAPDLTAERARLSQLNNDRATIVASLNRTTIDAEDLDRQLASLIQQRESISVINVKSLEQELQRLDGELRSLQTQEGSIRQRLDELNGLPVNQPSPVLIHAGQLLSQMTEGELTQVFVAHHNGHDNNPLHQLDLQIRDSMGRVHNFTGVDQSAQDHVCLSTAMAMVAALSNSNINMPMVIDDSFVHIGPDHVSATLQTLDQFCRQHSQQVILLSQHRYLADRLPSMPVFELPPTLPTTTTTYEPPARTTPIHVPDGRYSVQTVPTSFHQDSNFADQAHFQSGHNRPYPLSKYSVNPAAVGPASIAEVAQPDSDFRLPWSPLNRQNRPNESKPVVRATTAREFADLHPNPTPVAIDSMSLASTGLFALETLADFHDAGVTTVEQLLELNPEHLRREFHQTTLTTQQIETAQSETLIFWSAPSMSAADAKLLVAVGIFDPETLMELDADRLVAQVRQFLNSVEGQNFQRASSTQGRWTSIDRDRAKDWHRSLSSNRSRWSRRARRSRGPQSNGTSHWQRSNGQPRSVRSADDRAETYRVSHYPQRQRMDHGNMDRNNQTRQPAAMRPSDSASSHTRTNSKSYSSRGAQTSDLKLKFYLDLSDDLEAAPSIGPKTAERFEKIGVHTVADFLRQTAESMETRLKYKRLTAELLRTWQHQTRLACRIPNLRGHDAQLLVACGVTEPDELAAMQPEALFDIIGPFSDTKEGLKIIRSGKKPDLAEVTDWINWAEHTRSLQAA